MEVHHHTHHPKKWKEYITEFLMLFLAVSLGFLAENIREGQIEDHRAKEFLELFKNEVKANNKQIDSVLKQAVPLLVNNERLYYFLATSDNNISLSQLADTINLWIFRFSNDKRIFDQMKNSGALRYIKNQQTIDLITSYEIEADMAEFRAFDQETPQWKEWWRFMDENMPSAFQVKMLGTKKFKPINDMNPEVYTLYSTHKEFFENKLAHLKLSESIKDKLTNYIAHRVSLQKLSIANYKRVQKKGDFLLKELEEYISKH